MIALAIVWTSHREPTWEASSYHATLGKHDALVWKSGSGILPWRGNVRWIGGQPYRARSYRTEAAAKLATGERLRKAAT